jgi:hypothetical protein
VTTGLFVALFVSIKGILWWVFRDNPGSFVEFQLPSNLNHLTMGWTFTDVMVVGLLVGAVSFTWQKKPAFLKTALFFIGVPQLMLALFLGIFIELRAFYELYPVLLALVADTIYRLWGLGLSDKKAL